MNDPDRDQRLKDIEERIARLRGKDAPRAHQEEHYSQAQHAWRMVIELVAGLMIGFGMGYGLDTLMGTLPVFLVVFTLLGLAAGIKTMMRTAAEMQAETQKTKTPETGADERAKDGD